MPAATNAWRAVRNERCLTSRWPMDLGCLRGVLNRFLPARSSLLVLQRGSPHLDLVACPALAPPPSRTVSLRGGVIYRPDQSSHRPDGIVLTAPDCCTSSRPPRVSASSFTLCSSPGLVSCQLSTAPRTFSSTHHTQQHQRRSGLDAVLLHASAALPYRGCGLRVPVRALTAVAVSGWLRVVRDCFALPSGSFDGELGS